MNQNRDRAPKGGCWVFAGRTIDPPPAPAQPTRPQQQVVAVAAPTVLQAPPATAPSFVIDTGASSSFPTTPLPATTTISNSPLIPQPETVVIGAQALVEAGVTIHFVQHPGEVAIQSTLNWPAPSAPPPSGWAYCSEVHRSFKLRSLLAWRVQRNFLDVSTSVQQ